MSCIGERLVRPDTKKYVDICCFFLLFVHHPFETVTGLIGPRLSHCGVGVFCLYPQKGENMNRVIAFVDGFNLYHSLADNPDYHKYKWLDIRKLIEIFVPRKELKGVYYFTALTTWNSEKVGRHKILIRALEQTGIDIVYGQFRRKDRYCPHCHKSYASREEKQTDVNIAIQLFRLAIEDRYDTALILSGDSDLLPSIRAVKSTFASKRIGVLIPIGRRAEELKNECDFHTRIREKNLAKCLFADPLILPDGASLAKPSQWS